MTLPGVENRIAFVRAHTKLLSPSIVPEIKLHLAGEVMNLWTETEAQSSALAFGVEHLPPPYWAFAWPGGQAVARYILDHPAEVAGQAVLDFGAGSGLVAIAAAKAGANPVIAAELDPLALAAMELNGAANGVFIEPVEHDIIGTNGRWGTVLAGDMCYERPLAERLLGWLRSLAAEGARVLIGDPGRNYFPAGGVERLVTYSVPTSRDLEDREMRETSVYVLLP
ncbi:MAG TPA: 50S ribosomal protein L11 methyltransferase [Micropepsaceae bacterium]|jgi:predicted nicotinamide N-methyase|nr:50S ribosomal protein L11 methyltransferase [Micropepsaceae bacterium]